MPNPIIYRKLLMSRRRGRAPMQPLTWFNDSNMLISADTFNVRPNGGSDFDWTDPGRNLWSNNIIPAGKKFFISFRIFDDETFMGATKNTSTNNSFNDINFSSYRTGSFINFWENGAGVGTTGVVTDPSLEIAYLWDGAVFNYYFDGNYILTSPTTPDPTKPVKLKGDSYHTPGSSTGVTITDYFYW